MLTKFGKINHIELIIHNKINIMHLENGECEFSFHGNFKIILWQNGPPILMTHLALHKFLSNQMLSKNKPELTVSIKNTSSNFMGSSSEKIAYV